MDLADNDLLDLLLRRREPEGALDTAQVQEVLGMLRQVGGTPAAQAQDGGQTRPDQITGNQIKE
jgi:antitoxin CptB